jgi:hypothetical protein
VRHKISLSEWAWLGAASLIVMLAVSAPYLVGWRFSTPEKVFGGFLLGLEDMHSYIAKMRYGAVDGWMFRLSYTTEPHQGGVVYVFYLALGKATAWLSGQGARVQTQTLTIGLHAARLVFGLTLLVAIYAFAAEFLETPAQRRLAWGLAALAGGWGWLPYLAGWSDRLPVETYIPEAFSLLLLYSLPHLALARSLFLAGWIALFHAERTGGRRWAWLAGAAWLGTALCVPFYVGILGVLIAAWLGALWLLRRRFPAGALALSAQAGTLPLAALVYSGWVFISDPVFAIWWAQNRLVSPPPVDYALAYGLLGGLAVLGAAALIRRELRPPDLLILIWPPAALILAYLPVNVQRRLLEGMVVPLTILATLGIWRLVGEKSSGGGIDWRWRLRQIAAGTLVMSMTPSLAIVLIGGAVIAGEGRWPISHSADELAALRWLELNTPAGSVVLSSPESGNLLPAYASVRAYVGHGPETLYAEAKKERVKAFFGGGMTDDQRRDLLSEIDARAVWVGPPERERLCQEAGCFDPGALGLREAFRRGDYVIYEASQP